MTISKTEAPKRQSNAATHKRKYTRYKSKAFRFISAFIVSIFLLVFCFFWLNRPAQIIVAEDINGEIENAIFTRQEFFGSQAIAPIPTAEARENLASLAENSPDNIAILEKLAEFNEKLLRFDEAENNLKTLAAIDEAKLEKLVEFYERRARFEDEAQTLRRILVSTASEKRAATFVRLIGLARKHDLKSYLQIEFYSEIAGENSNIFPIFERLIDNLITDKNYAEALKFTRQAQIQFPVQRNVLLEKEVEILLETNKAAEAETVYQAAFDPFWSETQAQNFYDFLNGQDRLRAYGSEMKARFKKNPSDFDAAIRLALYQNHDYLYENDSITPVILKLERAKKNWTTAELVTVSRLLIQSNEADLAARFLYALYLREDFRTNSELRAKILYQLFEMFSDAGMKRLPITKGDLSFYEDVAKADTNPGITTGILSLIFSDTNPREKLAEQENKANKLFNRAAAYRIFEEYKRENPASDELAQMYLDIVRLYAATKDTETAEKTLNEFAERYESSRDFPAAALKLADAFVAVGQESKAREVYQKTLDYLGRQESPLALPKLEETAFSANSYDDNSKNPPDRNGGINIPVEETEPKTDYFDEEKSGDFRDFLDRKTEPVTYREVLEKYVASFIKDRKTAEIHRLYSGEISKYPDEGWLYEQRLTWLEKANLTDEQLEISKTALARFQSKTWRDKIARFFVRNARSDEFAEFSENLIGTLNDADARDFLADFVDGKVSANDFEKGLYLRLYQSAHRRFPHNYAFALGLLRFYKINKLDSEWLKLAAEYYFASPEIRDMFLDDLARKNQLRDYLEQAKKSENVIYELFRADASARLSDFENSLAAYRKLNELYPNAPEFSDRLVNFTRSFGQKDRNFLNESANVAVAEADFQPSSAERRTRAGEIYAESGDYEKARGQWEKLLETARGDGEIYLDTATVYWDYFQYDDALQTIKTLREKFGDETLYAFEAGAILEAKRKKTEAVGEYVKALDANRDPAQKDKAVERLTQLSFREKNESKSAPYGLENIISRAFSRELGKRKDSSFLSLGYAEFLAANKQRERAESVLNEAIGKSANKKFLEAAKDFYQSKDNAAGEQIALQRLAETEKNPRLTISYRLQSADLYGENQKRDSAKIVLEKLVRQFPTNYGVITETSDFYKRLGFENESAEVLKNALPKSRGAYRNALSAKLARRLIQLDKLDSAERILTNLLSEDKTNVEIFKELVRIYVRTNKPDAMRKSFGETVSELKKSDVEPRETDAQIADLRTEMIDAFTKLGDYKSAVEQYIEIINREPENEELTENGIRYVQRFGGAETLIGYYEKTAAEAFKNYRWNLVLARIYESSKDFESAIENYRAAIVNQPEMPELYLAVAELETQRGNFDEALKNIDEVLEISGGEVSYIRKKIEILTAAGRFSEIEPLKAELPADAETKTAVNRFAEAQKLQNSEKEKAREIYREAFGKLLENPLEGEFNAADISGYALSLRDEEALDKISENFWILRRKLMAIADQSDGIGAGEARKRLETFDGALIEAIGGSAKNFATDEELKSLHEDLRRKIEEASTVADRYQTLSLVQNLSRRAGFGDLEETILIKKVEANDSAEDREIRLRSLVDFYNERGAFQRTFDALEKYESGNLQLKSETAKLVGNREKELESLRAIYRKTGDEKVRTSENEHVARYLEILHAEKPDELVSIAGKSSIYQLQLINFLLGKGERELAHAAIENSNFSAAWKVSRHAETSLALREFDETSECFFCAALQFDSIGEMVRQNPDKRRFLINDDWFRLTREYGEWLFEKRDKELPASQFLTALIENQPRNANEQYKLGEFYLEKGELKSAVEHLRLAVDADDSFSRAEKEKSATLGSAYFKIGRGDYAEELSARILADESVESGEVYFRVLQKYDLSEPARAKLPPIIVKFLETNDAENSEEFQKLIRAVAASFDDEAEKSVYFQAILRNRPTDKSLAAMLVGENLIGGNEQNFFYELLIGRSHDLRDYDYEFRSVAERVWTKEDAEAVYEQANEYKTEEPETERYEWQKKYLELLTSARDDARAERLIREIEKELKNRYARPAWLQAAKIRLEIRRGTYGIAEAKRFIGITVSDSATKITAPSAQRFTELLQILKEENRSAETVHLSEFYFARMLALGQYGEANFSGLARAFYQKGETEKASDVLRLMIDAGDENKRETALAETAKIEAVKMQTADAAKLSEPKDDFPELISSLNVAAETAFEFRQFGQAIAFRRRIMEAEPNNSSNKIELAEILAETGEKEAAEVLLTQIIGDKNALRADRWLARSILNAEMPNMPFDSFSQFYSGKIAANSMRTEAAIEFYINSLIADNDAEVSVRQELFKLYAATGKLFAALNLAEIDKSAKSDETLAILSETAETIGDFQRAINFENAKTAVNTERIFNLTKLAAAKNQQATDFKVDSENTRKL